MASANTKNQKASTKTISPRGVGIPITESERLALFGPKRWVRSGVNGIEPEVEAPSVPHFRDRVNAKPLDISTAEGGSGLG
jgi:hypothetical protein